MISNAPKNDAAKTMNTRKKRMFGEPVRGQPVEDVGRHGIAPDEAGNDDDRGYGQRV